MSPGVRFSASMEVGQSPTTLCSISLHINSAVKNVTTSDTVQTVSGLIPNCVYTFRVAAVGVSQKIGRFSSPVNTSLPGECRR